ncbi:MAG TPA: hypothetical protein VKY89_04350 [Thermoanaerobaculia bacterium]|nr:hypothetical protein [Thermoanaerobaculia bacterium]
MKKQERRITLDRETVRRLDRLEQGAVKGAVNFSTGNVCTSHTPYTCSTNPAC